MTTYSSLGIHPGAKVIGFSMTGVGNLLLRAKLNEKSQRYLACLDDDGEFKYFRKITSSERKRVGQGTLKPCPLEKIDWVQDGDYRWWATHNGRFLETASPYGVRLAPTDYRTYLVDGELVSNQRLKEMI